MIKGTGIDIVETVRFSQVLQRRGERFLNRIFSSGERAACGNSVHRLAARFAAKEALFKALGTGLRSFRWREVQVANDRLGAPYFRFSPRLAAYLKEKGITRAHLSISHSRNCAVVQVILEGDE